MISRLSKKKEATYDFLAFMANKKNAFFNSTNGWTGVQPGMKYEYFPPVGSGKIVEWENQGWDKANAIGYMEAYYQNLVFPVQQLLYLRIPGAAKYWRELMCASPPCSRAQQSMGRSDICTILKFTKGLLRVSAR